MRIVKASLLALVTASTLGAQDPAKSMFGLGVTFNPGALLLPGETEALLTQSGFNNILVPIRTAKLTFEPEFGINRTTVEREIQTGPSTFTTVKSKVSMKRIGAGLLKHLARRDNLEPYVAPRIGFIFASSEEPSGFGTTTTIKTSATNFYLTGAAGAQYFFSSHFTLGGEAQLTYTKIGKPEVTGTSFPPSTQSGSTITTLGVVTIRWYH
jgi:hypothetical protein